MGWSQYHPVGLIHYSPQRCYRGYTLLAFVGAGREAADVDDRYIYLIDMEGRVCHRWESREKGLRYARLLPNGHLLCRARPPADVDGTEPLGGAATGLLELDWDSHVVWEYCNPMVHHDFWRLPNGNTAFYAWQRLSPEQTASVPGGFRTDSDPERMLGDMVQEIQPDGSVVYEWRAWEHLDVAKDFMCPLERRVDWTHANSLRVMPDGDLLVSLRQIDLVGIVDRASGEFRWRWGRGEISHQHDVSLLDNGRVLLFDNGAHRRGATYSRVVEVDPATDKITWEYRADPLVSLYSFALGGAERLPNGNTLITEGTSGRLIEVTSRGEIVWEYINPFFAGRGQAGTSNAIFRAHRYAPDDPALNGKDLDPGRFASLNALYVDGSRWERGIVASTT